MPGPVPSGNCCGGLSIYSCPVDSLCPHEADLARKAFKEVKRQPTTFLSDVMPGLLTLLSRINCRKVPSPASFHIMMGTVEIIQVSHETVCSNGRDEFRRSGTVQTLLGERWCKLAVFQLPSTEHLHRF